MKQNKFLKAIKDFLKKHWQKWTILIIGAMVVYIGFVFYLYVYKPIYKPEGLKLQKLEIEDKVYQNIIDIYQQRKENIDIIFNKEYIDVFK